MCLFARDERGHGRTAARMVLGGEPLDGLYDRAWFADRIKQYEPTVYDFFRPNPPPAALIVAPVAFLPYGTARAAWVWLNLVAYVAIVLYLGRAAGLGRLALPAFVCLGFAFQSIHDVLRNGQVYVLVLALAVVAWRGYLRRREAVLGGTLASHNLFSKVTGLFAVYHDAPGALPEQDMRSHAAVFVAGDFPKDIAGFDYFDVVGGRYAVMAHRREHAVQWINPPIAQMLLDWPIPAPSPETPFLLVLLRGKAFLRMEYSPPEMTTFFRRSLNQNTPLSSQRPRSPVRNQPSRRPSTVASGRFQ